MRRDDKEIKSRDDIDHIIRGCQVCHLALANANEPYLVPVSFGYDGEALYFHTGQSGRKIDFIEANNRVCFEFERNVRLETSAEKACKWTFSYESVVGYGFVSEMTGEEEKSRGLNQIMRQYSGRYWDMETAALATTRIWRVVIETISGKRSEKKST